MVISRKLLVHFARRPASFAWPNTGKSSAARTAMIAITTNNSIKVNAERLGHASGKLERIIRNSLLNLGSVHQSAKQRQFLQLAAQFRQLRIGQTVVGLPTPALCDAINLQHPMNARIETA